MTQAAEVAPSGELGFRPAPPGGAPTIGMTRPQAAVDAPAVEAVPAPARGLEFLGAFVGSGHRRPPSLVRRADGQTIQLTPVLYTLLQAIDGRRTPAELAALLGERIGKTVTTQDIQILLQHKLHPLGLLRRPDGTEPVAAKANPLLAIRMRFIVSNPNITRWVAAPFQLFFLPPVVVATVLAFFGSIAWLFFDRGLAPAVRHALYEPSLLLLVFALTVLSAAFHELGHAAACSRGGARPGAMGVGLYLIWPAFYTDVSDSYRLDRRGRLRVDLGGIYFNALFAVMAFGLWAATGWEALLIVIPLQVFQMLRQLLPLVRLDGYHILADLTGVPDLFAHIKPILLGMLPSRWGDPETKILKPKVKAIVTAWVVMVVPLLVLMLAGIIVTLPAVATTAWDSAGVQLDASSRAWNEGDLAAAAVALLSMLAVAIPVLSMVYLVTRVVRRTVIRVWRGTSGRPVMRTIAGLVAAAIVAMVATAWWPHGQYEPIQAGDRGAIDVRFREVPLINRMVELVAGVADRPPTTVEAPSTALEGPDGSTTTATASADPRVSAEGEDAQPVPEPGAEFRFTEPDAPDEGDNQALAVNYEDGSTLFDVALSLIFDTDDVADQTNEAYALASCTDCSTVAIAFQVLLVLEQADVVVPQNVAVAVNAFCVECFTYSLAFQTIYSLQQPLSDTAMAELMAVWKLLEEVQANIDDIPIDQLYPTLLAIQNAIVDILEAEGGSGVGIGDTEGALEDEPSVPETPTSETDVDDPAPTGSEPTAEPSPEPTEPSPEPSEEPTAEPSPEPTSEPAPESSP